MKKLILILLLFCGHVAHSQIGVYLPHVNTGTVVAGTGITSAMLSYNMYYNGPSAVVITANPQIANGLYDGQPISITGSSNTNTLTISHGNGVRLSYGLTKVIGQYMVLKLHWSSTLGVWVEDSWSPNQ